MFKITGTAKNDFFWSWNILTATKIVLLHVANYAVFFIMKIFGTKQKENSKSNIKHARLTN